MKQGISSPGFLSLEVVPTIVAPAARFEEIVRAEARRTLTAWKDPSPEQERRHDAMTSAINSKLLHTPIMRPEAYRPGRRIDLYLGRAAKACLIFPGRAEGDGEE